MPAIVQKFWTKHSERSVLPTGLGVLGVSGPEKDFLGRWRVAKLQLKFAVAARDENRCHVLDEREVASSLQDWLKDRRSIEAPPIVLDSVPDMEVEGPDADSDSQEHPEPPAPR